MVMSFVWSTESRYSSWATTRLAMSSSTGPPMRTIRCAVQHSTQLQQDVPARVVCEEGMCNCWHEGC